MTIRIAERVSVIVTCYNRETYIEQCLNSITRQTYPNLEIVIVDDCSTDNSVAKIRSWHQRLPAHWKPRVHLVRLQKNRGYAGAVTAGMKYAKGEYFAMQDSDDLSHRDRIRKQVAYLKRHSNFSVVGSNYRVAVKGKLTNEKPMWLRFGWSNIRNSYRQGRHCVCVGTILMKAHLFDTYGGMNQTAPGAEDAELLFRYLDHGVAINNLRDVLYTVQSHLEQRSRTYYGKKKKAQ